MAEPAHLLFLAVPVGCALLWVSVVLWRSTASRRLLRAHPTPIGTADELDLVRIEGRVSVDGVPLLRSPIEGRPCVGYYLGLEYFDEGERRHVPRWFALGEETLVTPFRVVGEDGHVIEVDADQFDIEVHFVETGRTKDPPRDRVAPVLLRMGDTERVRRRPLAYVEVVIEAGAHVSLVGKVLRPSSGTKGAYRSSGRVAELGPLRAGDAIRLDLV